jgi:hypothetical protein
MPTNNEFSRVDFGKPDGTGQGESGHPLNDTYRKIDTALTSDPSASLFSSTFREGQEPENLLNWQREKVDQQIQGHADILADAGLTAPIATLGTHPWMRDGIADPGLREPGNAEPDGKRGVPMQRDVKEYG